MFIWFLISFQKKQGLWFYSLRHTRHHNSIWSITLSRYLLNGLTDEPLFIFGLLLARSFRKKHIKQLWLNSTAKQEKKILAWEMKNT